jgi:hypothetical protein
MTLSIGGPEPEPVYFNVPVKGEDASASRLLVISLKRDKEGKLSGATLRRYENSTPLASEEDLKSLDINVPSCEASPQKQSSTNLNWYQIVGLALAQERRPPPNGFAKYKDLLESSDPFVRRNARQELGGLGPNAIPIIEALLNEQSYQLQLGALVSIDSLPASVRANVPDKVRNRVQQLQQHPDETMRKAANAARRALQ